MSTIPACCICSSVLDTIDSKTEKPTIAARHLSCCSRPVCQRCIANNPRYNSYCPYCQISTDPRSTLPQGLRDPPPYNDTQASALPPSEKDQDAPPAYSAHESLQPPSEKAIENAPDVLHFLTPTDTALSLSLAYGVPLHALRKANNVFADRLLQGRRTVVIPGDYYKGGVSLSPRPIEGEEEELRKSKLRRFMVTCKVSEYDVAQLYLEQNDYDLDGAVEAYKDDEKWEKEHPLQNNGKGKMTARTVGKRRYVGSS
ncbi:hypothetical protein D6D23_00158 [Aureobasidium pullulans]|uniref:LysM domain-containing protein n=1 Tax=Aureobasidium pullulans TaxID=5580 RepID=A0A4S9YYR5_AURPU|nr:hypothetical protein D6D23_00158 [Aureobasidium pullulans]THW68066.1 hypothetical protein D6D20_00124 [Aureobasidium pullulans]THZ99220.1 hypothetical protein D6C82_05296 [Aureobasidium pullulans]